MATAYLGQIVDSKISIIPCQNLKTFFESIKTEDISEQMPLGIQKLILSGSVELMPSNYFKTGHLITADDKMYIKSLKLQCIGKTGENPSLRLTYTQNLNHTINNGCLSILDLQWLYRYIQKQNIKYNTRIYLHELLEGSKIVLPKNQIISRNKDLDERCKRLEAEQQNKEYQTMTKNVNNLRQREEDDTISCQIKMINRHLIAVFQYLISIITGFVFGFYGIELMTTRLDLGFRLLLGIICSITVALAELYFLARALSTDLKMIPRF